MDGLTEQLKRAIRTSGLTRYAISKATGIDQGQLSKFMKGETTLGIAKAEQLADFLGLEIMLQSKSDRQKRN